MGKALIKQQQLKFYGVILFTFRVAAKNLHIGRSEFLDIWIFGPWWSTVAPKN